MPGTLAAHMHTQLGDGFFLQHIVWVSHGQAPTKSTRSAGMLMVKVKFMNMMPCQDYQNFLENLDFRDIRSWDLIKFYWSKARLRQRRFISFSGFMQKITRSFYYHWAAIS